MLANECAEENAKIVKEACEGISCETGGIKMQNMWKMKKKVFPSKNKGPIIAKRNGKGKLVTNPSELRKLYLDTFKQTLSQENETRI